MIGFSSDPLASPDRPARAYVAISLGNGKVLDVSERAGEVREMDPGNFYTHAAVIPEFAQNIDSDHDGMNDMDERAIGRDPHRNDEGRTDIPITSPSQLDTPPTDAPVTSPRQVENLTSDASGASDASDASAAPADELASAAALDAGATAAGAGAPTGTDVVTASPDAVTGSDATITGTNAATTPADFGDNAPSQPAGDVDAIPTADVTTAADATATADAPDAAEVPDVADVPDVPDVDPATVPGVDDGSTEIFVAQDDLASSGDDVSVDMDAGGLDSGGTAPQFDVTSDA
jgi:hypothetical protein